MSIVASCGCQLTKKEGFGATVWIKDRAKDGTPCASCGSYCQKCYAKAKRLGILMTKKQIKTSTLAGLWKADPPEAKL